MNETIEKIFEILGVKSNELFKIKSNNDCIFNGYYKLDENLILRYYDNRRSTLGLADLLNGDYNIIKLPKKKKLRDWTENDMQEWREQKCDNYGCECHECPFKEVKK